MCNTLDARVSNNATNSTNQNNLYISGISNTLLIATIGCTVPLVVGVTLYLTYRYKKQAKRQNDLSSDGCSDDNSGNLAEENGTDGNSARISLSKTAAASPGSNASLQISQSTPDLLDGKVSIFPNLA